MARSLIREEAVRLIREGVITDPEQLRKRYGWSKQHAREVFMTSRAVTAPEAEDDLVPGEPRTDEQERLWNERIRRITALLRPIKRAQITTRGIPVLIHGGSGFELRPSECVLPGDGRKQRKDIGGRHKPRKR